MKKGKVKNSLVMLFVFFGYCVVSNMDYQDQLALEQYRESVKVGYLP